MDYFFNNVFSLNNILLTFFCIGLFLIAVWDCKTKTIPDQLNLFLALLALPYIFLCTELPFSNHLAGAFIISVPLFLFALFLGGFGGGDIKLTAAAGLFLGWQSILHATIIAFLASGIFSAILLLTRKANAKTEIPFGPFLSTGILLSLL